ncbi:DUF748 domain-containing protein [Microbulbifer variabilis]|uniref:DUF748 domain-containing protein n=1 Tax=Microbulbifer variabilis TaxID=266805 RepID=A0ABY4VAR1_9GAMM|nr:DUF748 domain-containing protein [Microbulbifer variabilis]USD21035.1 DUF748 domain-containing protein [Microbulbifer variabilis]
MPTEPARHNARFHHLLWWLIGGLLLLEGFSFVLSGLVRDKASTWMAERGLDFQAQHFRVSLLDLSLLLVDARAINREGRGFSAQEILLDYSWWQLLRGRANLPRVSISGAYMDLQSVPGEWRREWEVGGWDLAQVERKDRDFKLAIERARIRNSELCYLHKPIWSTASCVYIGDIRARDFTLGLWRKGNVPLKVDIAAAGIELHELLARERKSARYNTTLAHLQMKSGDFRWPSLRTEADAFHAEFFSSCPPQQWADAIHGLQRLIGHCAAARRLKAAGDLKFDFGRVAMAQWRRANGEGVILRRSDQRWQDWRAETITIRDFDYVRPIKRLRWRRAGATAFDWCPQYLRDAKHHFCVRATTLNLPGPTKFDWNQPLKIVTGPSRAQQVRYVDVAQPHRQPLTAQQARLGPLEFDKASRILSVGSLSVNSASGCVPGELWGKPDHCVRLVGLRGEEKVALRFGSQSKSIPWGAASGPMYLGQMQLEGLAEERLRLRQLKWEGIDTLASDTPYSIQDFSLESLSGCLSRGLLPEGLGPLCAQLSSLKGRGNFAWQPGEDGYAIFGKLRVQRLMLGDSPSGNKGLLLQKMANGSGYFRREAVEDPWAASAMASSIGPIEADYGTEKGNLEEQGPQASNQMASVNAPNFKLENASLQRLDGCLPDSWARLIYRDSLPLEKMPTCFDFRDLRQQQPLRIAWRGGFDIATAEFSIERALAHTTQNRSLLNIEDLNFPLVRIRYLPSAALSTYIALPESALEILDICLPDIAVLSDIHIRCMDLQKLHLGEAFHLEFGRQQASANLNDSSIAQIQLLEMDGIAALDIQQLSLPELEFLWSRNGAATSEIKFDKLSAESLLACLPQRQGIMGKLPHCIYSRDLHSINSSGVSLGMTEFTRAASAEPIWQFAKLDIPRIYFSPGSIDLYDLTIDNILVCGLQRLFPSEIDRANLADCIETPQIKFTGNPISIGFESSIDRISSGAVYTGPIAFWQKGRDFLQAGLQQLSWRGVNWNGGKDFSVADLKILNTRVCLPDSGKIVTIERLERSRAGDTRSCYGVDELYMPGLQRVSLSRPFTLEGSLHLAGLSIPRKNTEPIKIPKFQLDNISFEGEALVRVQGASGCLPAGLLKDKNIAPCYQLSQLRLGGMESLQEATGRIFLLRDISVAEIQMHEKGFTQALSFPLLKTQRLQVEQLRLEGRSLGVQQLRLLSIASCIPAGYFDQGIHCFKLGAVELDGNFNGVHGLTLPLFKVENIDLFSPRGELLVEGESIEISHFSLNSEEWYFAWGEAVHFHFFNRDPGVPEFERHSTIGDFRLLHIKGLSFHKRMELLTIDFIDFLRPRFILLRDEQGQFPVTWEIAELRGIPINQYLHRKKKHRPPLLYHIGDIHLRHGTFTWVDRKHEFRARLPVRDINLNLSDISNVGEHPPAVIVANGRPGGFGDIQLGGTIDYLGQKKWNADLTGYLANVNLIPATPYMAKLLGFKILQGQMDAVVNIHVYENQLNAFADVVLEKIKVRRVRKDDQLPVKKRFIPLNLALWLLKDGKGNVKFGMPVTGNIRDPKFSMEYVFSELLHKAIMDALFSYFTPYGIYLLAKLAWGRFMAKSFDSIDFAPGSAELSGLALAQLQQMVAVLHKHPDARPGVCGIANARDWNTMYPNSTIGLRGSRRFLSNFYRRPPIFLREEFEKLALERSRKVERYLIDAGIPAAELIPCAPDYMGRDFGDPRVEFSN